MKRGRPTRVGVRPPRPVAGTLLALAVFGPFAGEAQELTTMQISRQIADEEVLTFQVEYVAGRARLVPSDSRTLYAVRLVYDAERVRPVHEYTPGRAEIGVTPLSGPASLFRRGVRGSEIEIALTNRIPINLDLELGAVEADLDLGGLRLRSLTIETGASDGTLRVSAPNPEELGVANIRVGAAAFRTERLGNLNAATIRLEAGIGSVELDLTDLRRTETALFVKFGIGSVVVRVPREAGVRIQRSVFLTSVDAPGLDTVGDLLVSPGYDRAERRVDIRVEAGLGSIELIRSGP